MQGRRFGNCGSKGRARINSPIVAFRSAKLILVDVDSLFPAESQSVNRELCQILIALNAPNAVARIIVLLMVATTQEEQVTYAVHLRNVKTGWNPDLRRTYLSWWNADRSRLPLSRGTS